MLVELHILQNFAPSCLNRDDTNTPKDCLFGGHRRARISSQCGKRAIRNCFSQSALLPPESLAKRTKRLIEEVAKRLSETGKEKEQAASVAEVALKGVGLGASDGLTQYLIFLGEEEIKALTKLCAEQWDVLAKGTPPPTGDDQKTAKKKKKTAKEAVPPEIRKAVLKLLDGGKASDLALFGRMLADLPGKNIDAACQVAHAISTNKVGVEFDFYTAVDDLNPEDTVGAGMMGTVQFNSACFYRYANIDIEQLKKNLHADEELARKTIEAFLHAAVTAIPTGKQNSMAAQNPPSFIFAVVRDSGLWSLANAFVDPVRPSKNGNLVQNSITRIEEYWQKLVKVYGENSIETTSAVTLDNADLKSLPDGKTFENLVKTVMDNITFKPAE